MRYFDCHADTLTEMDPARETLLENGCDVDLARTSAFARRYTQVFAVFDDVTHTPDDQRDARFDQIYAQARRYLDDQREHISLVTSSAEMHAAHAAGKAAAFLSIEDASVMGSRIGELYDLGFRFCMLAWNHDNLYACGAVADQAKGLTERGRALASELVSQGVVMDISHTSDAGVEELFSLTDAPIMASHSNVRDLCGMPRNLARWQLEELIRRKGLIGLNFFRLFVGGEDASLATLIRHADYILGMGGEDALALGGDFDGCDGLFPAGIEGVQSMPVLRAAFAEVLGEDLAEKIFFANAEAFIDRVL